MLVTHRVLGMSGQHKMNDPLMTWYPCHVYSMLHLARGGRGGGVMVLSHRGNGGRACYADEISRESFPRRERLVLDVK